MAEIVKNKRGREILTIQDMPALDGRRCIIALLPGKEGYKEMIERIYDEGSVHSED